MPASSRLPIYLSAFLLIGLGACSSADNALETDRAPTEIRTDADRQAAYNRGLGSGSSVPDATPGRVPQVREQAAASGGRQRIETVNTNAPNNTTQEERVRRIQGNATLATDTLPRP
ncbi:hypothetical protein [Hymenobacter latericus]|uniref:hypothetical protein n=1 Tax=Hymenobacter sp. YIM 151858-1 TaxID=2987688 RepID=UPI002226A8C8|nr:hypothetical protein [Hymenobacter sp. YIM 151858-1]UYZ57526.1 hypothetical protein OIS50_10640 [Hymenobacter sp. YIM 151858-1]